jgi:hypothetical protein
MIEVDDYDVQPEPKKVPESERTTNKRRIFLRRQWKLKSPR